MTVSDRFGEQTEQGTQDIADQSLLNDFNLAFENAPKHNSVSGKHPRSQLNTHNRNLKMVGINNTQQSNAQQWQQLFPQHIYNKSKYTQKIKVVKGASFVQPPRSTTNKTKQNNSIDLNDISKIDSSRFHGYDNSKETTDEPNFDFEESKDQGLESRIITHVDDSIMRNSRNDQNDDIITDGPKDLNKITPLTSKNVSKPAMNQQLVYDHARKTQIKSQQNPRGVHLNYNTNPEKTNNEKKPMIHS